MAFTLISSMAFKHIQENVHRSKCSLKIASFHPRKAGLLYSNSPLLVPVSHTHSVYVALHSTQNRKARSVIQHLSGLHPIPDHYRGDGEASKALGAAKPLSPAHLPNISTLIVPLEKFTCLRIWHESYTYCDIISSNI